MNRTKTVPDTMRRQSRGTMNETDSAPALDGLVILDFTPAVARPYLNQMPGGLVADVIKVEAPAVGADEETIDDLLRRGDFEAARKRGSSQ